MSRRALVLNCSTPHYNLGAAKLADWLRANGWAVTVATPDLPPLLLFGYDLVCLSVIFSWHAPAAVEIARQVKGVSEVWCGGPGVAALATWWRTETGGLEVTTGLDWRFERQRGAYEWTFSARGCPVNCSFCIVPRIEGTTFTLGGHTVRPGNPRGHPPPRTSAAATTATPRTSGTRMAGPSPRSRPSSISSGR